MSGRWADPGHASSPQPVKHGGVLATILATIGIGAAIIVASPGARHYYRHGSLPR